MPSPPGPVLKDQNRQSQPEVLHAENLSPIPWLVHGFSTRSGGHSRAYGGALNLAFTREDTRKAVERNRAAFIVTLGALDSGGSPWPLVTLRQLHSDIIQVVSQFPAPPPAAGDGLVTRLPGILLAVQTADCLPVIMADEKHKAVGIFHAGWRGTVKRIVEKGTGVMRREYGSDPATLQAAIGPGIHQCCYLVGDEVRQEFQSQMDYGAELFREPDGADPARDKCPMLLMTARPPGHGGLRPKLHLDLVEANRRQLMNAGLRAENIFASALCSACRTDLLFSHRAEQGRTGRMLAAVGVKT